MTRKPIDQVRKNKKPQGQDGVWAEIRRRNIFTITEIVQETEIDRKTATDYLKRLIAGGYVEEHASHGETSRYVLVRDVGVHAPRVRPNGQPVTQGQGNVNMWRSMRMMGTFTPRDLAAHSTTDTVTVDETTAKSYCSMLLKADYLRVVQKAVPGKRQATYKFVRNTGPQPPKIQRVKQVYDPNLDQVTYYPEARP